MEDQNITFNEEIPPVFPDTTPEKIACPYLKVKEDTTIRFGYPHVGNYCHYVSPPQSVVLDYQADFCLNLSHPYWMCVLLNQNSRRFLPGEALQNPFKMYEAKTTGRKWVFVLVLILSIAAIVGMFLSAVDIFFWMVVFELIFISLWGLLRR